MHALHVIRHFILNEQKSFKNTLNASYIFIFVNKQSCDLFCPLSFIKILDKTNYFCISLENSSQEIWLLSKMGFQLLISINTIFWNYWLSYPDDFNVGCFPMKTPILILWKILKRITFGPKQYYDAYGSCFIDFLENK